MMKWPTNHSGCHLYAGVDANGLYPGAVQHGILRLRCKQLCLGFDFVTLQYPA